MPFGTETAFILCPNIAICLAPSGISQAASSEEMTSSASNGMAHCALVCDGSGAFHAISSVFSGLTGNGGIPKAGRFRGLQSMRYFHFPALSALYPSFVSLIMLFAAFSANAEYRRMLSCISGVWERMESAASSRAFCAYSIFFAISPAASTGYLIIAK